MSHQTQLPRCSAHAWMNHGRTADVHDKWIATIAIFAPGFSVSIAENKYGVQDDFGNFVEVPHAFI